MTVSRAHLGDQLRAAAGHGRGPANLTVVQGFLHVVLTGPDGEIKYDEHVSNLVTQLGDQYYAERAAGVAGAPAAATGMQLGTGVTAAAKTGAGAAIVTLVTASLVALSALPTSGLDAASPPARILTYTTVWGQGVATANSIAEVALVSQAIATQTAAPVSATVARALLSPIVNKGSLDTLTVNWVHALKGA